MYEEITVKRHIDWKLLFFRLAILLLVVFIICAIAFTPRNTHASTPYNNLAKTLLKAGKKYYIDSKLPTSLGYNNTITLRQLIDDELLDSKDYNDNDCNYDNSYVRVTKVGNNEYSIYAYLFCNGVEEVIGDSITSNNIKESLNNAEKKIINEAKFDDNENITVTVSE